MRVLVTGGAGFIGSNFVRRIFDGTLSGVSSITVLDKLTYAGSLSNLNMLPEDSFEFIPLFYVKDYAIWNDDNTLQKRLWAITD